jgi:poly-gamma-glutamate capsule biosynthesis protein CapA/YwtB (metallophosphatase superfamily)
MLPEALAGLTQNGVRAVTLANNHLRDCGDSGIVDTLANLDRAGIAHFGGGPTPEEANRPLIVELGELRIGLIGVFSGYSTLTDDGAAPLTKRNLRRLIKALRPQVDLLIVSPHWGENYRSAVDDAQREMGRVAIELGADAVVGHGAHIWQGMEIRQGKPIVYSVGNCAFGTGNPAASESLLAELIVENKRLARVILHPVSNFNRDPEIRWQPQLAVKQAAYRILNRFVGASKKLGAAPKIVGGKAAVEL